MTRRKRHQKPMVIQRKIWSRFERVTPERTERNRLGRAACEQAIKERRKDP